FLDVTRRPHSSDVVKSPQATSSKSNARKSDRTPPTIQRPSIISTNKSPSISPNSQTLVKTSNFFQSIILFCMENARSDIALRIVQRMAHKRDDFAQFYANLSSEQSSELIMALKKFLKDIVRNIPNLDKIRQISSKYGIEQAHKRSLGFKADFFAVLADALTTECVFLDGAAHQPTETIEAWASLVELMFSSVRDGYYMETRQLRRNWQKFHSQSNVSSQSDQSLDGDSPQSLPSLNHMFTAI
uniref:GLOBIN domain-containing protein n=1 Tax=Elaeophora elaphi TaxID=1147741 RepID=A0A0R3RMY8_9BILA